MDIKPIIKRRSGQAFEVILKPPSPVCEATHCVTTPPRKDISLEDIQKKLEAAEDRRRVRDSSFLPPPLSTPPPPLICRADDVVDI